MSSFKRRSSTDRSPGLVTEVSGAARTCAYASASHPSSVSRTAHRTGWPAFAESSARSSCEASSASPISTRGAMVPAHPCCGGGRTGRVPARGKTRSAQRSTPQASSPWRRMLTSSPNARLGTEQACGARRFGWSQNHTTGALGTAHAAGDATAKTIGGNHAKASFWGGWGDCIRPHSVGRLSSAGSLDDVLVEPGLRAYRVVTVRILHSE